MSNNLTGKVALVTGGSRGIGRAIARRLAADGATVAITYKANKQSADETVSAIEETGRTAFALQADLLDAGSIPLLYEEFDRQLMDRTGGKMLDILVNNAGNEGWANLSDATPEAWDAIFAVHARAPFFMVQSALDRFSGEGRIINLSSGLSTRPLPAASVYSTAKAAINTLTHVLAM